MEPPTNLDTGAVPLNPIKASDAPVPAGKEPHSSFALFKIQLRAILHKNLLLSKRDGKNLAREILVPAYWFLILVVIRLTIHDQTHDAVIVAPTEPTSLCMNSTKPHLPVDCYDPQCRVSATTPQCSLLDPTDRPVWLNPNAVGGKLYEWAVTTESNDKNNCSLFANNHRFDMSSALRHVANELFAIDKTIAKTPPTVTCYANTSSMTRKFLDAPNTIGFGVAFSGPNFTAPSYGKSISSVPWSVYNLDIDATVPYTIFLNTTMSGVSNYPTASSYTGNFSALQHTSWPSTNLSCSLFGSCEKSGFSILQHTVHQLLVRGVLTGNPIGSNYSITARTGIYPTPSYKENAFAQSFSIVFPLYLTLAFTISVRILLNRILEEKEKKLKEGMLMIGLNPAVNIMGWVLAQAAKQLPTTILIVIIGHVSGLLQYSSPVLLVIYFTLFSFTAYAYCFVVSSFFSKSQTGGLVGYILFSAIQAVGILPTESSSATAGTTTGICLLSPAAFYIGNNIIFNAENNEKGVTWSNMGDASIAVSSTATQGSAVPFTTVLGMLVLDTVIYSILAWYLDNVIPNEYGTTLKWNFCFTRAYWCGDVPDSGANEMHTLTRSASTSNAVIEEVEGELLDRSSLSIQNLEKRFKAKAEGSKGKSTGGDADSDASSRSGCCKKRQNSEANTPKVLRAVANLSLDMYEGHITCLLGHNGAGKSTTISMLTGLYPPTSGTATVYNKDLVTQMGDIRHMLGVCPQHDILWPLLTVEEHLRIFASIQGMEPADIPAAIDKAITDVDLQDKRDQMSKSLSGGMKRRLSVAMAIIGNPKIIFLDEPTSGLDPQARRGIWSVLSRERDDKVIVLTTHFMDEADMLGDRIAIMSAGRLKCVGSSLFLKNRFGIGYHLTLTKKQQGAAVSQFSSSAVTNVVKGFVPEAQLQTEVAGEISFLLPLNQVAKFPKMLDHLEQNKEPMGLESYAVSVSTLEEVFLKIAEQDHAAEAARLITNTDGSINDSGSAMDAATSTDSDALLGRKTSAAAEVSARVNSDAHVVDLDANASEDYGRGARQGSFWRQVKALLRKRWYMARRDSRVIWFQNGMPVLGLIISALVSKPLANISNEGSTVPTPLTSTQLVSESFRNTDLNFSSFQFPWMSTSNPSVDANELYDLSQRLGEVGTGIIPPKYKRGWQASVSYNTNITWEFGMNGMNDKLEHERLKTQCKASSKDKDNQGGLCVLNVSPIQGNPAVQDVAFNISAGPSGSVDTQETWQPYGAANWKSLTPTAASYEALYSSAIPAALPSVLQQLDGAIFNKWRNEKNPNFDATKQSPFAAFYQPFPQDASTQNPIGPFIAGLVLTLYFSFFISTIGALAATYVKKESEPELDVKRQQIVGGCRLSAYWTSNFLFDCLFYFCPWVLLVFLSNVLRINGWTFADGGATGGAAAVLFLFYGPATISWCYMFTHIKEIKSSNTLTTITLIAQYFMNLIFLILFAIGGQSGWSNNVQQIIHYVGAALSPGFATLSGLYQLNYNTNKCNLVSKQNAGVPKSMIPACNAEQNPFAWDAAGMSIVFLVGTAAFWFCMTLIIEFRAWREATGARTPVAYSDSQGSNPNPEDADVEQERHRIENSGYGGANPGAPNANVDNIVCKGLTKQFPSMARPAVDNITLGIPTGQCFGLLGPNGAGKTTTLGMLTGDVRPSSGTASMSGLDIATQLPQIFGTVGFCPQFDALPPKLTGREVLQLYCEIKGIDSQKVNAIVESLLEKMTLLPHAEKMTEAYSGGNKRKLSLAIAMLGDPSIIFLDEPSTGMDPQARRAMWDVISSMVHGRSIVLTTHLMEECEALCQRIGIVVKGRLACLGTPQRLKERFGDGYSVEVKTSDPNKVDELKEFIVALSPQAQLGDHHGGHLHYQLAKGEATLAEVFRKFEAAKSKLSITEYAISQTSLEQVFLRFAKEQDQEDEQED